MTQPVTLVTRDATLDDLSAADYRDIYDELRGRGTLPGQEYSVSLDRFVTLVTSQYSKAQWSKYHNGETQLTRAMRNELRRAMGLPQLPPTVAEATAGASPDAAVWSIGDGPAEHVIMVTTQEPLLLHVNGSVSSVSVASRPSITTQDAHVTGVTHTKSQRRYCARPAASAAQNLRRAALGVKWTAVIDAGLKLLESESAK